jgi:hypothetical protein
MNIIHQPFWVVTKPTPRSVLGDICWESDFKRIALQYKGGLLYSDIYGIYTSHSEAVHAAYKLLENRETS